MAFGSPRPLVTIVNLLLVVLGGWLALASEGFLRLVGVALFFFGVVSGFAMGSWWHLFPERPPVGADWQEGAGVDSHGNCSDAETEEM